MTDQELEIKLAQLVGEERRITNEILHLINLAESRKLYLARGYSSVFDWLVQKYGYSNAAAYRRMQAARAIRVAPEISEKLEDGSLNLTTVAKAQSIMKAHEKTSGSRLSQDERRDVFRKIENQSSIEAEQTLMTMFPENPKQESRHRVSEDEIRLFVSLTAEAMGDLEWLKAHWSHIFPDGKFGEILARALKSERERCEKPVPRTDARKIALKRADGKCQFKDPLTGRVCGSTHQVQVDHIVPVALGGLDELSNMRCLCRSHNLFMAEQELGKSWANHWRQ